MQVGECHRPLQRTFLATEGNAVIAAPVNRGRSIMRLTKEYARWAQASSSSYCDSGSFSEWRKFDFLPFFSWRTMN